jgi:hypothetical protein
MHNCTAAVCEKLAMMSMCSLAGAQELSLLLEVSEMYCHVSPSSAVAPPQKHAWPILSAVHACSPHALASFASTSGEALISIAEHLVEDVLLVMGTATGSHSNSKQQPRHGAGNPDVTLKHRLAWAQDMLSTLGLLCRPQPSMDRRLGQGGEEHLLISSAHQLQADSCCRTCCLGKSRWLSFTLGHILSAY